MTTIKNSLIPLATIVFISSLANADIANPDHGIDRAKKITLFGHTGQDPAPEPDEATWHPGFFGPNWFDVQMNKNPLPTKDAMFSITFVEEVEITSDFPVSTPDWSTDFNVSENRFVDPKLPTLPNGGTVPAPPAALLFALGFLIKHRRVE